MNRYVSDSSPLSIDRKSIAVLISIIVLFVFSSNRLAAQTDYDSFQHQKDSLLREIALSEGEEKLEHYYQLHLKLFNYEESIDSIKKYYNDYIDESRRQGNLKNIAMIYVNLLGAYCNRDLIEEAEESIPAMLEFMTENKLWVYYYQTYSILLETYFFNKQYSQALAGANDMYQKAKEQGNNNGLSSAYYFTALVYSKTNRTVEAEEYFRKCIAIQSELESKTSIYTQAYFFLFENLMSDNRLDEAMQLIQEWGKAIEVYERYLKAENPIARAEIYASYARVCMLKGEIDKALLYCDSALISSPDPSILYNTNLLQAYLYKEKGDYSQALQLLDDCYDFYYSYGEWDITTEIMLLRLQILLKGPDYQEAWSLLEAVLEQRDFLTNEGFHAQIDELRTRYEVDKLTADKEIRRQQLIIAIGGCILLLIILIISVIYLRRLKQKNLNLYDQVQVLSRKEKVAEYDLLTRPDESLSKEMRLYKKVSEYMKNEKPFANPDLSRKILADALGTNEAYLAEAIKAGSGETYSGYLAALRLQYALDMMNENPSLTFEAIAIDSGHGSYSQFFRSFSKKYGINPSEYRKMSSRTKIIS